MQNQNISQLKASNPEISVWVSASAGTGKTKVLTDRVLRLLLSGIAPEKILCLTFTNAAAQEMKSRIVNSLQNWQNNPDNLEALLSRKPNIEEISIAKSLFTKLLLSPEQLAIHTIHSFCQKILQKFPFEANIQPGFKVLSEMEMKELSAKLIKDISTELNGAMKHKASFEFVLRNVHQLSFNELIMEIIYNQINFRDLFEEYKSVENYQAFQMNHAGIDREANSYIKELIAKLKPLPNIPDDLQENELSLLEAYNKFLQEPEKIRKFSLLIDIFYTKTGAPRKKMLTKKHSEIYPHIAKALLEMQTLIMEYYESIKKARMIEATIHIYKVAEYIISKYSHFKHKLVSLDYDDLIYYTKKLLSDSDMHDWVLYKLDGGISHLLIDEAQDTSPKQWQIIEDIMQEFYAGEYKADEDRTVFVVGDEKQSIYSFQGADVSNFSRVNNFIASKMKSARKKYEDIELEWVYRSAPQILELVSETFKDSYLKDISLKCFREDAKGEVEIWPILTSPSLRSGENSAHSTLFWPSVQEMEEEESLSKQLAKRIASYIKNYIDSGKIMPSTGKPACAGDFMILIRRRNEFTDEIISELKEADVAVAGIDRMLIMDHLSVKDIISAAKFALLPEDDLNLASLLKSPLIGMNDEEIAKYASTRKTSLYGTIPESDILENLIHMGINLSAFDFLHNLIDVMGAREILVQANGDDSSDALDELLNISIQHSKIGGTNLQSLIHWLEKSEVEIKRDIDSRDNVRVMTVHASKGLESSIIIMPDTTKVPRAKAHFLWKDENFLWLGGSKNSNELYMEYKQDREDKDYQEYMRLLYVAMTRAEDHLVVCGYQPKEKLDEKCWYSLVKASVGNMGIGEAPPVIASKANQPRKNINLSCNKSSLSLLTITREKNKPNYVRSPLDKRMDISYGIVLHKVLEDSVKLGEFSLDKKHPYLLKLPEIHQNHIMKKLPALFQAKEFTDLLKYPNVQTEASMGYMEDGAFKFGRIDLLAMSETEAIIIDYKSESEPPKNLKDVPELYVNQLNFYAGFIKKAYPNLQVTSKILWLENFSIMEICSV